MENAKYIGNVRTREFHEHNCFAMRSMDHKNKIPLRSMDQALNHDFDPCGHCLGTKKNLSRGPATSKNGDFQTYYQARFYGIFNDTPTESGGIIAITVGDRIQVFVELVKFEYSNVGWTSSPMANHPIDLNCDGLDFPTKNTNASGQTSWETVLTEGVEPGTYQLWADYFVSGSVETSQGNYLYFSVPQAINNIRVQPNPFDQQTTILFSLEYDKKIKAEIYKNLYFLRPSSLVATLRDFDDGPMTAGEDLILGWDGTTDHGIREGESMPKGNYVIRIMGENGESDMDFAEGLEKSGGILGGTNPAPDQPTEYVKDISFSPPTFRRGKKTTISFELLQNAKVTVVIQHVNWMFRGECVRALISNKKLAAGPQSFTWDGLNNDGFEATHGEYKVQVLADDAPFVKMGLVKKWF